MTSVNNFSRLWGLGAVPSSLATDPELTGAGKGDLEYRADREGV